MADHIIEVKLDPTGAPVCDPETTFVKRGDRIVWGGALHRGTFDGKLQADNSLDKVKHPFDEPNRGWLNAQIRVVRADAETGKYKYTVIVGEPPNEKVNDPVVVVDE